MSLNPIEIFSGGSAASPALISGGSNLIGTAYSNYQNKKEAKRNRNFQERMSGTAYQRAVVDMKKAGINPMLAYMKGGASTPGGSQARFESPTKEAVNSALAASKVKEEVLNLKRQNDLLFEQTRKTGHEADSASKWSSFNKAFGNSMEDFLNLIQGTDNTNTGKESSWWQNKKQSIKTWMQEQRHKQQEINKKWQSQ